MSLQVEHNKSTDVAFIDICAPANHLRIDVVDVTDDLGLNTTVLARFDENGKYLGLTIEDYPRFRREIRRKYVALKIEGIIELIVSKVRDMLSEKAHAEHPACA